MPLPEKWRTGGGGSSFMPAWSSPALGAFSAMPKAGPPVMASGDSFTVGAWKAAPTGQNLSDWNAWLKRIGMPENTFTQFNVNPKAGQYAFQKPYDPTQMTYSQYAKNAYTPFQPLTPPVSANTPIPSTPIVTRSTVTLPSTTTSFPKYNAPATPPRLPRFTPERDYNPFPAYNQNNRVRTMTR